MPNDIKSLKALANLGTADQNNNNPATTEPAAASLEDQFIRGKKNEIINDIRNYVTFIQALIPYVIRFDSFSKRTNIFGAVPWEPDNDLVRPWKDTDTYNLSCYSAEYGLKRIDTLQNAIDIVADRNAYNPLTEFLESLPYNGDGYIRKLLPEYMGCLDTEYTFQVMKLLMLGMVTRAFQPGCKFDYVVVLVGRQGSYKSSFFKVLARDDNWFTDSIDSFGDRKKIGEQIQGKLIAELPEMSAMKKTEIESIKACITSLCDSYREAYGHYRSDYPRVTVFVGTTNERQFLKDSTGNRRFLIVPVNPAARTKDLFTCETRDADFNNAWAEAVHLYKELTKKHKIPSLVLPESVRAEAERRQELANAYEEWAGIITTWLSTKNRNQTCALDIWCNCFGRDKGSYSNRDGYRINAIMDSLPEWERCSGIRITLTASDGKPYFDYRGRGFKREDFVDKPPEETEGDFHDLTPEQAVECQQAFNC